MDLGHTENILSVFLAIGNDVGSSFNYELRPTIQEFGPGVFCFPGVPVPADLGISEGTNATIQVMTNAHSGGGLYNVSLKFKRVRSPLVDQFAVRRHYIHIHRARTTVILH